MAELEVRIGKKAPVDENTDFSKVKLECWFILYLNNEWIAFGGYNHGWLGPAYVKPECRGYGFQRLLIRERLDYAREKGESFVLSYTINQYSLNNFLAEGFYVIKQDGDRASVRKNL